VVTPFAADGTVALDALETLCLHVLRAGAAGIVALGTTGEASALDADEKRTVVSTCARVCSEESRPLIVGAGTNSTAASVAAARALAGTPALAAVLSVVPYYVDRRKPASSSTSGRSRWRARFLSSSTTSRTERGGP
jgi:4-hydroxy-tetrahydrodipicolinate synthase